MTDLDAENRRAIWRSRRGLLELDLLLPPFARNRLAELSGDQQSAFRLLLECEDTDIWAWMQGREAPTDPALADIVAEVMRFGRDRGGSAD